MIVKLAISGCLVACCVFIHAVGVMAMFRWLGRTSSLADPRFWPPLWLLIRLASWLILMHLCEISLWALCYFWGGAMPDCYAAFYFSSVTYTTVGYGDLVLPHNWRLLGGVEALTGILMCGWSTGFFFMVVDRMFHARSASSAFGKE